jgi:hypothetical protein
MKLIDTLEDDDDVQTVSPLFAPPRRGSLAPFPSPMAATISL